MLSNRPYLIRAFHEWIVDSNCTPILVINAFHPQCKIPKDYAEDGEIVFNISSTAVRDLKITNTSVEFKASFSGVIHIISAPISAILAVYAEENSEGIFFDGEEETDSETALSAVPLRSIEDTKDFNESSFPTSSKPSKVRPLLKLIE